VKGSNKRQNKALHRCGQAAWCVFALATALIAMKAVSLLASTLKTVGGAG